MLSVFLVFIVGGNLKTYLVETLTVLNQPTSLPSN